jgi:hypothetical protein
MTGSDNLRRRRVGQWIRWYFLPTGGLAGYTLRVGVIWFAPLMFVGTHILEVSASGDGGRTLGESIIECLICGLVAGLGGYPIGRWALQAQAKLDERRGRKSD